MSGHRERLLDALVPADRADRGCDEAFAVLDEYVDLELAGGDPAARFPGTAAHVRACPACDEEYAGLRAAAASAP